MTAYEIPFSSITEKFSIQLGGVDYVIDVRWNSESSSWVMDFSTPDGAGVVYGVSLTTGADLLEQYGYLGINGSLYVQTDHETNAMPTEDNLGQTSHVYFVED